MALDARVVRMYNSRGHATPSLEKEISEMVEKPTAVSTTDDATQQPSSPTTVSKGPGKEPYPGADKELGEHISSHQWDDAHNLETFKNEWNQRHPDHPFATANAFKDAIKAQMLREGGRPEAVEETIRQMESLGKP